MVLRETWHFFWVFPRNDSISPVVPQCPPPLWTAAGCQASSSFLQVDLYQTTVFCKGQAEYKTFLPPCFPGNCSQKKTYSSEPGFYGQLETLIIGQLTGSLSLNKKWQLFRVGCESLLHTVASTPAARNFQQRSLLNSNKPEKACFSSWDGLLGSLFLTPLRIVDLHHPIPDLAPITFSAGLEGAGWKAMVKTAPTIAIGSHGILEAFCLPCRYLSKSVHFVCCMKHFYWPCKWHNNIVTWASPTADRRVLLTAFRDAAIFSPNAFDSWIYWIWWYPSEMSQPALDDWNTCCMDLLPIVINVPKDYLTEHHIVGFGD